MNAVDYDGWADRPGDDGLAQVEECIYVRWRMGQGISNIVRQSGLSPITVERAIDIGRYMLTQRRLRGWL
jgi:hypothetical protein